MKFVVMFKLQHGSKNQVMDTFEERGPNRSPGVSLQSAWVGTRDDVIFAFGEAADEQLIEQACRTWDPAGNFQIYAVIDIQQF